jgi:hypothetical protein
MSSTPQPHAKAAGTDLVVAALACIRNGVSIIPIDHLTKRPLSALLPRDEAGKPRWEPFQRRIASEDEVREWFGSGDAQAFAAVCGRISGGLLGLDFDREAERLYPAWRMAVGTLADGLPVQRTGGGPHRRQIFFRCADPGTNGKLSWITDEQEASGRAIAIETRAEGGFCVVGPSLHPSGRRYEWLTGDLTQVPTIPQAQADALLAAARKLDECPHTRHETSRLEKAALSLHKKKWVESGGTNVIEAYNKAHPIDAELEARGYTKGPGGRFVRPGGKSESVSIMDGRSCHWSSNDPLNDGGGKGGCGGHDAFGIYCHYEHGGDVSAAVKAAAARLGLSAAAPKETQAVRLEPFVPFPLEALPEPVRSFVAEGAKAIGCDPSFIALPLLPTLASAIGNARRVQIKRGWTEPAIIWAAIVGDSGTLKSPALELALRAVRKRQHAAMTRYAREMKEYRLNVLVWEKAARARGRNEEGEAPVEPEEPTLDRCYCDDTTMEALSHLLLHNWRGLLLARDELSGWLGSFNQYRQGRGGDAAKWVEMFGGRPIMVDRKGGDPGPVYIPRAAVSIVGGIQPETLHRALGVEHRENGLAARLLTAYPPRGLKRWSEADISPEMEGRIEGIFDRLYGLTGTPDEDGELQPVLVPLSPEGKAVWVQFYNEHAEEQVELTGDLAAVWSKLEGYAARLALVIHLVRWAVDDPALRDPNAIDAESIMAGVRLSRWFGHEARRVGGILEESNDQRDQRRLVEMIRCKGGATTTRELMRSSSRLTTAAAAQAALEVLVKAGLGRWEDQTTGAAGGRPTSKFILVEEKAVRTEPSPTLTKPPLTPPKEGCVSVIAKSKAPARNQTKSVSLRRGRAVSKMRTEHRQG